MSLKSRNNFEKRSKAKALINNFFKYWSENLISLNIRYYGK